MTEQFFSVKYENRGELFEVLFGDLEAMNEYMNRVSEETFSFLIRERGPRGSRSRKRMGMMPLLLNLRFFARQKSRLWRIRCRMR